MSRDAPILLCTAVFNELCVTSAQAEDFSSLPLTPKVVQHNGDTDDDGSDTSDAEWLLTLRKRTATKLAYPSRQSISPSSPSSDSSPPSSSPPSLSQTISIAGSELTVDSSTQPAEGPPVSSPAEPAVTIDPSQGESTRLSPTHTTLASEHIATRPQSSSSTTLHGETSLATRPTETSPMCSHLALTVKRHRPRTVRTALPRSTTVGNPYQQLQWSPDGSSVALVADDGALATIYTDAFARAWEARAGGTLSRAARAIDSPDDAPHGDADARSLPLHVAFNTLYTTKFEAPPLSLAWHPSSRLDVPHSSCLALALPHAPVQLRDALSGHVRATYPVRGLNEEFSAPTALAFGAGGTLLVAGGQERLRVFAVERDGGEPVGDVLLSASTPISARRYSSYLDLHWQNSPQVVPWVQRYNRPRCGYGYGSWFGYGYGFFSNPYQLDSSCIPANYLPLPPKREFPTCDDAEEDIRGRDRTRDAAAPVLLDTETTPCADAAADAVDGNVNTPMDVCADEDVDALAIEARRIAALMAGIATAGDGDGAGLQGEATAASLVLPSIPRYTLGPLPPRRQRKGPRGALSSTIGVSAPAVDTPPCAGSGHPDLWLAGTFAGDVALVDMRLGAAVMRFPSTPAPASPRGPVGGVTSLAWCQRPRWSDGSCAEYSNTNTLFDLCFAVGRRSCNGVDVWDMRQPTRPQVTLGRVVRDQQRMGLSCDSSGRFLATGSQDPAHGLLIYDLDNLISSPSENADGGDVLPTCLSAYPHGLSPTCGVSIHPYFSQQVGLVASISGYRKYAYNAYDDDDDITSMSAHENTMRMWVMDW